MTSARLSDCAKTTVAWSAGLLGATARSRRAQTQRLRVLMYHGVLPAPSAPASWGNLFITQERFARQMRHLATAYRVLSLEQVIETIEAGRPFPDRAVAITFDDGYRQTLATVRPILQALRLPATVFVVSEMAGGSEALWFDALRLCLEACLTRRRRLDLGSGLAIEGRARQDPERLLADLSHRIRALPPRLQGGVIQQLAAVCREDRLFNERSAFVLAGWDEWRQAVSTGLISVGSHGRWHGDLRAMSNGERREDLESSKHRIERELSGACRSIAYPYGVWDAGVAQAARAAGYACGLTTDDGVIRSGDDPFALHRTMVGDKGNVYLFRARVSGWWGAWRPSTSPPISPPSPLSPCRLASSGRQHAARL